MDVALRNKLMNWAEQYETAQFIEQDPVQFPRMYSDMELNIKQYENE